MCIKSLYERLYRWSAGRIVDEGDRHALACIYAIAAKEACKTGSLSVGLGLRGAELCNQIECCFPEALPVLAMYGLDKEIARSTEENAIRQLLLRFRTRNSTAAGVFAALIACRAMRPNHLWQDLGLRSRAELSALMRRHFEPLTRRNRQDMKWKKFFFRQICREEGLRLCTAPECSACTDFESCFGDESGESLLAQNRLRAPMPALVAISAL